IARLKNDFGHDSDLVVHYFKLQNIRGLVCANIYIKSLVDKRTIDSLSIELSSLKCKWLCDNTDLNIDMLMNCLAGLRDAREGSDYEAIYTELLSGNTVFLVDG